MSQPNRRKFLTNHEWHTYLAELQNAQDTHPNFYALRRDCYKEIEELRGRPLLVYYVYFPNNLSPTSSGGPPINIDFDDVDGFTDLVDSVPDDKKSVDVLLHSPGGSPEATERLVSLLRDKFDDVSFLIPHSAYSAATMMALSGNNIILHPSATMGPIDPQFGGIPTGTILRGFEKLVQKLKDEGSDSIPAYIPLINKYSLDFLERCADAEMLSKELVSQWLADYMFKGSKELKDAQIIDKATHFFANYQDHKTHSRSLTYNRVKDLGLNIELADGELKSLMREAHIVLKGFFELTLFVKLFENAHGLSWGRNFGRPAEPK